MSTTLDLEDAGPRAPFRLMPHQVTVARSVLALIWAAALVLVVGDKVPTTDTDLPTGAALLLASYPLIDVIASLLNSNFAEKRVMRANAAVSSLAVIGIAIAAFASDAGAALVAFGAWAVVSGLILLGVAIHRRRAHGRQLPLIVSGALSTLAGISFIAASGSDKAHVGNLAGYMAFGAVLFLLWAFRGRQRQS